MSYESSYFVCVTPITFDYGAGRGRVETARSPSASSASPIGQRMPRQMRQFDGMIVFGGPMSANDDHLPGIPAELRAIERWMHTDRPVWGICLGAQLMARVLGSQVYSHPETRSRLVGIRLTQWATVNEFSVH